MNDTAHQWVKRLKLEDLLRARLYLDKEIASRTRNEELQIELPFPDISEKPTHRVVECQSAGTKAIAKKPS